MNNIEILENVDPELAGYFKSIVNGKWTNVIVQGTRVFIKLPKGFVEISEPRIGRNDPCSCGSGQKYKKCCGRR